MSEKTNGAATNERAENGRFAPGNKGGPGNPFARQTAALRKAAMESASARDVAEVMAVLKLGAQRGDVAAARLWLAYTIGKPGASVDPDTLDANELEVRRQAVATAEDTKALFDSMPASLMCQLAGAVAPHVQSHMARTLAEGMQPRQPEAKEPKSAPDQPKLTRPPKADGSRTGPGVPDALAKLFEMCPGNLSCGRDGEEGRLVPEPDPADTRGGTHRTRSSANSR